MGIGLLTQLVRQAELEADVREATWHDVSSITEDEEQMVSLVSDRLIPASFICTT